MSTRAVLESLLRDRKLERPLAGTPISQPQSFAPTGLVRLDAHLGGGVPLGHVSEIAGPRSSGRTSLLWAMLAAATARGELTALVDTLDTFDPEAGASAGIDLTRLLWIRGMPGASNRGTRLVQEAGVDRALKALNLVLQCGNFGLVALDLADLPVRTIRQIPLTTWPRVQRVIEGSATACVLLGDEPIARSSSGLTLVLHPATLHGTWSGRSSRDRMLRGLHIEVRSVRSRFHPVDERTIELRTDTCGSHLS